MNTFILAVLVTSYLANIVGAVLVPGRRSPQREIADAIALPMTMFMAKRDRVRAFSALRVILFVLLYFIVANLPADWNWPAVVVVLGIPMMLILEPLFGMVPVREMMLAGAAYLGSAIADRIKPPGTTTVEVDKDGATKLEVTGGKSPDAGEDPPYGDMESGATSPEGQETQ